jgi:hypothetical protein
MRTLFRSSVLSALLFAFAVTAPVAAAPPAAADHPTVDVTVPEPVAQLTAPLASLDSGYVVAVESAFVRGIVHASAALPAPTATLTPLRVTPSDRSPQPAPDRQCEPSSALSPPRARPPAERQT